jgi:anti-anti-sigma factor
VADASSFQLITEDVGDRVRVVALRGDADRFRVKEVGHAIEAARADDREVVIDLSAATYVDSSMLAALVSASERDRRRSDALVVLVETPRLRRSFEVKGLQTILRVAANRDDAVEMAAKRSGPPSAQA